MQSCCTPHMHIPLDVLDCSAILPAAQLAEPPSDSQDEQWLLPETRFQAN